ncbi:MAG TPA: cell wall hydrolase [Steroidobacteraceae bacterium]|jgi:spore germination cell wall hydrolase CwlJ-like protein|nr:cell wall hydrolase [Steroidobacteraceae bacterium]
MLTSLLFEARLRAAVWRRRLAYRRRIGDRGNLAFFLMVGLPVLGLASIIWFASISGTSVEPARTRAEQRAQKRALRRADDLECLAENVYFEARGEPLDGQYAVAEVTLNRTRAQNFPHTICQVVHEMRWDPGRRRYVADFSWTELGPLTPENGAAWKVAMMVATAVYDDLRDPLVPGALFYHATSVRPGWARSRKAVATIGNHVFYR